MRPPVTHTSSPEGRIAPGRLYDAAELRALDISPARRRSLLRAGVIERAWRGAYYRPASSKWGPVPASDEEILRVYLRGAPYVKSGSSAWNHLLLGSTGVFAIPLIYTAGRAREVTLDGRRFCFRPVRFPTPPTLEWAVVDLIMHRAMAGLDLPTLERSLVRALAAKRFDGERLSSMATAFGTPEARAVVARCRERGALPSL